MSDFIGDWNALLVLLLAGFLPNEVWRMLGLWFGGGIDEGSELLVWVRAVATAILAGVIAQILVLPPGALASVPGWLRYAAVAAGFARFHRDAAVDFCRCGVRRTRDACRQMVAWVTVPIAFSSEVDTGSRQENAQKISGIDMVRESEIREGELAVDMPPAQRWRAGVHRPHPHALDLAAGRRRGRAVTTVRSAGSRFSSHGCRR